MLKNILNLAGVKELSKNEQKNVKGGRCGNCNPAEDCCHLCQSNGCVYLSCGSCPGNCSWSCL